MISKHQQDEIVGYLRDASNMPGGFAEEVCIPESEEELREALERASASGTSVTVAGAGTGLSGGRTPFGGIVVSMERFNRIGPIDPARGTAVVGPGVLLGAFQQEVESHGLFYPPDPTERNCFMGGTISTNSSGARTFKYGPTRRYVRRLRVMLSTGETLTLNRGEVCASGLHLELKTDGGRTIAIELPDYTMPAIKHAAGYFVRPDMDAIDLFIGAEGTLGVVTDIEVDLLTLPERIFSGVVFFPDEDATLEFVEAARNVSLATRAAARSGEVLDMDARALEFIDANALDFVREKYPTIPGDAFGGAVWFEQEVDDATEEKLLNDWYELILRHRGLAEESWFAVGTEDQRRIREFRHAVPSAVYEYLSEHGQTKLGTDMAVPDGALRELLAYYRSQFTEHELRHITYGHIGDNHLHANVLIESPEKFATAKEVYSRLVEKALALGGTISAEHGVGKLKKDFLRRMYGEEGIEGMRRVKRALDPDGVLGVGTMFDM